MNVHETADRLVQAANIRALEQALSNLAVDCHIPCARGAAATVAVVPTGHPPMVLLVVWLAPHAWLALGLLHLWGWWRLRDKLGVHRMGYRLRIWVTG